MANISVLLPVYQVSIEYLKMSIESILNQTYQDFEFIIINDIPSNQEISDTLNLYAAQDERIRLFVNPCNRGLVYSLNFALTKVSANYIARMDNDDIAVENRLQKQLNFLQENNLDLIGSNFIGIDELGKQLNATNYSSDNSLIRKLLPYYNCIPHPTFFAKREIFEQLNNYRDIPCCEDYDFLLRALSKGFQLGNYPDALLFYRIHSNSISNQNSLKQCLVSQFLKKNYSRIEQVQVSELELYILQQVNERNSKNFFEGLRVNQKINLAIKNKNIILAYLLKGYLYFRYHSYYQLQIVPFRQYRKIKKQLEKEFN